MVHHSALRRMHRAGATREGFSRFAPMGSDPAPQGAALFGADARSRAAENGAPDLRKQYAEAAGEFLHARRSYFRSHEDQAWPFVKHWLLSFDKHAPILDVGCGGGDDLEQYAALGFDRLYGIDPVASMVREAKALLGGRARVQAGSWQDMPCPSEFFAAVIGRYSLHYLRDLDPAFIEARRALKTGGLLIFVVSNPAFDAVSRCRVAIDGVDCIRTTAYDRLFQITYFCHDASDYSSSVFLDSFETVDRLDFTTAIDDQESVLSGLAIAVRKRR